MKNYQISISILITLLIISCKNRYVTNELQLRKNIIAKEPRRDTISVTLRNVLERDTFYLLKRDYPYSGSEYYEHVYSSRDPTQYQGLIPIIEYENFSLTNHPFVNSEWINHRYKIEIGEIPQKWTEVIYYGNEFYLNSPSDFCGLNQKIITDSCLISRTCEGPLLQKIIKVDMLSNNQYEMTLGFEENKSSKTRITLIDSERGIAVWQTEQNEYKFFADINKFQSLAIAISDCNGNKCTHEIESEKLDILELIENAI